VPSAAERQGDFGELCGRAGGTFNGAGQCSAAAGQIWDPMSGVFSSSLNGAVRSIYVPFNNLATYQLKKRLCSVVTGAFRSRLSISATISTSVRIELHRTFSPEPLISPKNNSNHPNAH
jgi:hypothetical protein